ncbi:hypothetical protein FDJ32_gp27 [Pseudomonas phage NV1]|uniref:Uncharacterized protein n=1 Tax=Pseudomonas phage NV1 TaxID=2079543 RepID=A0A2L0HPN6_9CAUD|nr:hypothetical protein FDJ32_gp27 [Pseudomonas phage NV1]AUX83656.1 hypothetical protein NV1_p27 [Pseudomonas phage NV1]
MSTVNFNDGGVKRFTPPAKAKEESLGAPTGFRVIGPKGQDITLLFHFLVDKDGKLYWQTPDKLYTPYTSPHKVQFI